MKKGFTLIELLVVIAIIGLLSSIVLVALGPARKKARDARRESDIRQISLAMEMCLDDSACAVSGGYPPITVSSNRISASTTIGTYLNPVPLDPGGGTGACATLVEPSAGTYCGVTGSTATDYCIYATLSDGRVFAASEKGAQFMAGIPASITACP